MGNPVNGKQLKALSEERAFNSGVSGRQTYFLLQKG
jgi:hypothetical protein